MSEADEIAKRYLMGAAGLIIGGIQFARNVNPRATLEKGGPQSLAVTVRPPQSKNQSLKTSPRT
jgi:hypothetical protein